QLHVNQSLSSLSPGHYMAPSPGARKPPRRTISQDLHRRDRKAARMNTMTAPLRTVEAAAETVMPELGRQARAAARLLARAPAAQKDKALAAIAQAIRAHKSEILAANADDLTAAKAAGATSAFLDRLALDDKRVAAMADGIEVVRALADPVGKVTESWTRPNGMTVERGRGPLGGIGITYQGRPNVTPDPGATCLQ